MSIKIVSLNIEGRKHLPAVTAFLQRENPEVVCLMEVFEEDLPQILAEIYSHRLFAPNYLLDQTDRVVPGDRKWGIAILSKYPLTNKTTNYYGDYDQNNLPHAGEDNHAQVLLMAETEIGGRIYRVGTTHFTWTYNGLSDERQRRHMANLLKLLSGLGEFILTGDFNIPRLENELYREMAKIYTDNIPQNVVSSIDPDLHYANREVRGKLAFMVDYLWTTKGYKASNVRVECGISDHCGVVAEIDKV